METCHERNGLISGSTTVVFVVAASVMLVPVAIAPGGDPTFATPVAVGTGGEPGVHVNASGSPIYVESAHKIWKSNDVGASWTDITPLQVISGDANSAVGSTGRLYYQSLWVGSSWAWASPDEGASWPTQNPFSTNPFADRNWIAAYGPTTVYAKADIFAGVATPMIYKSTDGGETFLPTAGVVDGLLSTSSGGKGALTVDPNSGALYVPADETSSFSAFNVVSSTNGGDNLIVSSVPTPYGASYSVILNAAVDSSGNAYVAWVAKNSSAWTLQYSYSKDSGLSWSQPVKVVSGGGASRVFPWSVANGTGGLDIAYYETTSSSNSPDTVPSTASWDVRMTQVTNAIGNASIVSVTVASGVHSGPICTQGVTCPSGTRNLLDFLGITLDPGSGNAFVVYTSDASGTPTIYFAKQSGGATI
jgi:hypothetical protein